MFMSKETLPLWRNGKISLSKKTFDQLTASLPQCVSYVDRNVCYQYNNPTYEDWFGFDKEEIKGKHVRYVLGNKVFKTIEKYIESALSGLKVEFESVLKNNSGENLKLHTVFLPDFDKNNRVQGFFAVVSKAGESLLTEKKFQAAFEKRNKDLLVSFENLSRSEEKFRSLADSSPDFVLFVDKNLLIQYINRTQPIHTIDQVVGTPVYEYVADEFKEEIKKRAKKVFKTGIAQVFETTATGPYGDFTGYVTRLIPIRIKNKIELVAFMATETGTLKSNEKALSEQNRALRELLSQNELDKQKIKVKLIDNVNSFILPVLDKLKKEATTIEKKYIQMLEKNLSEMTQQDDTSISKALTKLTTREVEICNMIRSNQSTKEISDVLKLSPLTVEKHRNRIRKKLGLAKKGINLASYLKTL